MISEFPLFVFTTLGGLAAGAYVMGAFFLGTDPARKRPWLFPLVCLALLGVGLLGVLGHLGRPERVLFALANPSSMIAEEAYWSIAFGVLMLVDLVLLGQHGKSPRAVRVVGALAAAGLMCCMAYAYFTSYGNPAWATWETLLLFLMGDVALGAALVAVFDCAMMRTQTFALVATVLNMLAAVSFALVGAHFFALGYSLLPFAAAVVLALLGAVLVLLTWKSVLPENVSGMVVFAVLFVGVVIARYAFYAASVL